MPKPNNSIDTLQLAAELTAAFVSNNKIGADELPALIMRFHDTLKSLNDGSPTLGHQKPAVPIEKSITNSHLICLEDGKKLRMLKRYIRTHFDMTPDEYRRKWSLPADYPMVAPSYSEKRSKLAKDIGLGKGSDVAPKGAKASTSRRKKTAPKKREPETMRAKTHKGKRILASL